MFEGGCRWMKIVQIIPSFNLAGAEVMVEHLSYGLSKRKNELYVIITRN